MAITSGFFNSVNHDRTYNAEQMTLYFEGLISNGIYESVGDKFQVTAGEGMTVTVGTGRAMIKSRWVKNDAPVTLTIDPASATLNRYDAIFLRYNATTREIGLVLVKGEETPGIPNQPHYIRNNDIYDLELACIRVMKNTTAITQDMIVDFRMSALCGYVTGLINQVDTSTLYDQWQTAYERYYTETTAAFNAYLATKAEEYEEWFASLTQDLRVDTTLKTYFNTVNVSGTTTEISIGIEEYDSNSDMIFVFANGVYLTGVTDYLVTGTGLAAKILLTKALTGSNSVTFEVIKSVIGEGSGGEQTAVAGIATPKTAADAHNIRYKAFAKADYSRLTAGPIMCKEANDIFPFTTFTIDQDEENASLTYSNTTFEVVEYSGGNTRMRIPNVDGFTQDGSLDFVDEYAITSNACLLSFAYTSSNPYFSVGFAHSADDTECMAVRSQYSGDALTKVTFGTTMSGDMDAERIESNGNYVALVPFVSSNGTKTSKGIYKVIYNTMSLHGFYEVCGDIYFISAGMAIKDE